MRILLITNLYEPYARGGAEIIVKRMAEGLRQNGHQVSIISAKPFSGLASLRPHQEEQEGIRIWRYYPLNFFFYANDHKWPLPFRLIWHFFDLFNIHSALAVRRILKKEQPDQVITHNLIGLGFLIPLVIRRGLYKHTHVLHDIQLAVRSGLMRKGEESAWFVSGVPARLYQAITRFLFGSPDKIISPSTFLLSFYEKLGYFRSSEKEVRRNPVDPRFCPAETPREDTSIVRFAYVGQIEEHKGIKTLLKAFEELQEATLTIVGDGSMREAVVHAAEKNPMIIYKGKIANEELPAFFRSIDATILPTETYENSPTVIFESLACGRPVIVSDIGGAAEPIKEGENGYTFEPANVKQLRERMEEVKGRVQNSPL